MSECIECKRPWGITGPRECGYAHCPYQVRIIDQDECYVETGKSIASATYRFSIQADSGYESEATGTCSPEQYGVVTGVLHGTISPKLVNAAADLLSAADDIVKLLDGPLNGQRAIQLPGKMGALRAAIAKARA